MINNHTSQDKINKIKLYQNKIKQDYGSNKKLS